MTIDYKKTLIKGADISTLKELEALGACYRNNGVQGDLFDILKSYDFNYIRLKLWNDPYTLTAETGRRIPYGAGTNDLETTISLAKRALEHDMGVLLNFHYSDFWADPGKQTIPKAWRDLDLDGLVNAVYEFTRDTINALIQENAKPTMVQIGNEITNGLLWPYGKKPDMSQVHTPKEHDLAEKQYQNIARLVSVGIRAVREIDPDIPVMLHLDNGGLNDMYRDWFDHYMKYGDKFDIIGLSYYPFWHGKMAGLAYNMEDMVKRYGLDLIIDEVSMGFTTDDYAEYEKLPLDQRKGMATKPELVAKIEHPMTIQGQCDFMSDIWQTIKDVPDKKCRGFFYWEPAWIPLPGSEWANQAAFAYTGESGCGGNEWANQALFDYNGNALPTLGVIRDFK